MMRVTSVIAACCLTLVLTAPAVAQVAPFESGRSSFIEHDRGPLPSRALLTQTYAAVPGGDPAVRSCRADNAPPVPEPDDPRWRWRLRAFHYLDCVLTLIDPALRASQKESSADGAHGDPVRLSREDAERIRTLAWWARDAAARIGQ